MLGLGYPGGPFIASVAQNGREGRFRFPRPMTDRPGLDFSFSGLKTACLTAIEHVRRDKGDLDDQDRADIAHAFQEAVVDTLLIKCRRAVESSGCRRLVMAGGVSANRLLRERLHAWADPLGIGIFYPQPQFCTDNGAMIAYAGFERFRMGVRGDQRAVTRARWPMTELHGAG